jgi:diacylglycerol kinase
MIKRFSFAFNGLLLLIKKDKNFRLHLLLFIILVAFSIFFEISKTEWLIVLICSSLVFAFEAINSCLENICNIITLEYNEKIKQIKDVAAGAVLILSVFSCIVALIIFIPKILVFLSINN